MSKTVARKSVPLTAEELTVLDELRGPDSDHAAALRELANLSGAETSEAAVLRALLTVGMRRVREVADERAYAALAETYRTDPEDIEYRQAARAHRRRSATRWDDEA